MDRNSTGPGSYILAGLAVLVGIVVIVGGFAWLISIHGVDAGHVAIVKEGGPFDGRNLKEVRQPGSSATPIGAFNHQYSLPVTQRDLTDEVGQIVVPTADGVNVVVDGQALFQLKVDGEPDPKRNLDAKFFRNFGLRPWGGENIWDDQGWDNFLKIRLVPILYQSIRQSIGTFDCTQLNNTCVYVLNANVLADTTTNAQDKVSKKAKDANTEQNLAAAELKITQAFQDNLKSGLGDDYFEGVRFQNLKVTFLPDTTAKVQAAQNARADVAKAKLEAQRKVQEAEGQTQVAKQNAEQIKVKAQAYKSNPQQAKIDQLKALCGDGGCTNLQVLGGNSTITQLK
jgi:hypothetical protein